MAVNKIGFIEQHFEKVVAGIGGAALLGVLAWQFVGGRSTISLGKGNDVPLSQAFARVADDANRLKGEIHSESPPIPEFPAGKGPFDAFNAALSTPVAGRPVQLADAFERYKVGDGLDTDKPGTDGAVVVPAVPAVATPTAHTFLSTLSPNDVEANPGLAALLPAAQPFDKAAVSVEGRFDGTALFAALQAAPSEGQRQLPRGWWENQTAILKVELMRQERKPDGTWTPAASVPPAPGREGLGAKLAELGAGADIVPVVADAWAMEDAIQRPAWYERPVVGKLTVGDEWQPPIEAISALESAGDAGGETIATVQRQLVAAKGRLDSAKKKLADMKKSDSKPAGSPTRGGTPGRGASPGGREPGPTGGASTPRAVVSKANLLLQERSVKDAEDRVKRLEEKLASMGVQPKAAAHKAPTGSETNAAAIFANPSIQVWNHDLTVERGKTYRYMIKVWVANPLYGRTNVGPEQKELAGKPALASADSAWTDPVRVDDDVMFFFTSAQDRAESGGGAIGRGAQASGDLYMFSWGHWRRAQVSLLPGDSPSGEVRIPDIEKIAAAAAAPEGAPGAPDAGGKPKDTPRTTQETALPTKTVRVAKDLVLLDAVPVMAPDTGEKVVGRPAQPFVAYVRDAAGAIQVRTPEDERTGEVYRRIRNSANAGELALVLKPDISPEQLRQEREAKKREDEKNKPPKPASGGSGGGRSGS